MSTAGYDYVLAVYRRQGRITKCEVFENVRVEVSDVYRIHLCPESTCFRFVMSDSGEITYFVLNKENQENFYLAWYEERYLCKDAEEVHDKAESAGLAPGMVNWLAGRI